MSHERWAVPGVVVLLLAVRCTPSPPVTGPDTAAEALFAAARAGDLQRVRRLVESGVPVDTGDRYDATALAMASGAGQLEVVRYLLDQGADPDRRETFFGSSPLDQALRGEHFEVAIELLGRGADDRETALELAVAEGLADLAWAAVESGPMHESRLQAIRVRAAEADPAVREAVQAAAARPDPPPPNYSDEELRRFGGSFEGWSSETTVGVTADAQGLGISIDGGETVPLVAVADDTFRSADGRLEAAFWGRAGTIEMVRLRRDGGSPESLRRSVAEPKGAAAYDPSLSDLASRGEATANWPGFRGPEASGIGDGIDAPARWGVDGGDKVVWHVELPGLGNSSPIVWGGVVVVTTAVAEGMAQDIRTGLTGEGTPVDEEVAHSWQVLAFDKATGKALWATEVGRGLPLTRRHFKASQANSTPVTDGHRIVAAFPTAGLACLDFDGAVQWKRDLGGLNAGAPQDPGLEWGFASSPVLYAEQVILQVDVHEGPYVAAWDVWTGRELWRTARDVVPSWATPNVLKADSGDELVLNGSTIHGYDPLNGEELWSLGPNSELAIATPIVRDGIAYVTAGYPPVKPIYALRAGTRGALEIDPAEGHERMLWSHERGGAYMPTPLVYRGIYYVVHHNGRIVAYDADSGEPIYKKRFSRAGTFTASPVAVNGKVYVPTEEGLVYVLEAGPEYREIAVNEFTEPLMATPAVSDGILLVRTPTRLIAIAERSAD